MSEPQHLVPNQNETMDERIEMEAGMNLELQSSMDKQLVVVAPPAKTTEQEQSLELSMEMNEQVLAVIPEEAEAGTVTESIKRKRRIEGA